MHRGVATALAVFAVFLIASASSALAAGPPTITATWATSVSASAATLHAQVNPQGLATTYHFEYLTEAAFDANLAAGREGFAAATHVPLPDGAVGSGSTPQNLLRLLQGLLPSTAYLYRVVATNSAGPAIGPTRPLETEESAPVFALPDGRGWEMVSPVEKGGGTIGAPGQILGGGLLEAAAQGGAVTYSASSSFGEAAGAAAASQYLAARGGAWSTANITAPQASEAEPPAGGGVPYRAFSPDLGLAILRAGGDCRSPHTGCADPSPPLPGSGAPPGYQDYYLRDQASGTYTALITAADATLGLPAEAFEVALPGASPDLRHIVLSTCAALTPQASEVSEGEGCDRADPNLYEWSEGSLQALNLLPGDTHTTPGAALAAPGGAISTDGQRVYFTESGEEQFLYLREGGSTYPLAGPAPYQFQTASADGRVAFFTQGSQLFRYLTQTHESQALAAEVQGVLGASADGSYVYYETSTGLFLWHAGATTLVAAAADPANYPPSTGTARVSTDGRFLAFSSSAALTDFDNTDAGGGEPDAELYIYDADTRQLSCASCNPTGERPLGSSSLSGVLANGEGPLATGLYKPRALSADGSRLFFDSSDSLALQDTNHRPDVYEWEAPGAGTCAKPSGCVSLISSGRDPEASEFIDASESGGNAFFRTAAALVASDPGSYDLYDAREGGGFPVPSTPIPCNGDACQPLPSAPEDPTPGTLVGSPGNPAPHVINEGPAKKRHKKHHKKKHTRKKHAKRSTHHKRGGGR